jgi:hypothetical protein
MKFNCTDIYGRQTEIATATKDAMIAALENPTTTNDKRELAKKVLAWYGAELGKPPLTGNSELDKAAQLMLVEYHATSLWDGTYRFEERPVKTSAEGKTASHEVADASSKAGKDSADASGEDGDEAKKTVIVIINAKSGEVLVL